MNAKYHRQKRDHRPRGQAGRYDFENMADSGTAISSARRDGVGGLYVVGTSERGAADRTAAAGVREQGDPAPPRLDVASRMTSARNFAAADRLTKMWSPRLEGG